MSKIKPKIQFLCDRAAGLLSTKTQLNSFWQTVAYNFYPQRAFFTRTDPFPYGRDFAANLTTSFPILVSRELTSSISGYLRPSGQQWFKIGVANQDKEKNVGNEARQFLEWATGQQTNFINDRQSGFTRATSQGDADFTNFGQCAISIEIDWKNKSLLHRCWNLRDMAWSEGANGIIDFVCREWKTTIRQAYAVFGDKLSAETLKKKAQNGDEGITIFHVVMLTDEYNYTYSDEGVEKQKNKLRYTSIYVEQEEEHEIECVGSPTIIYCIPRWQTVSGSQYAYSPAVVAALPDARLIQSITLSLLEAGEKAVNPPMIAKQDAVRSDISLMANTISWVAESYDGRVEDAVKVMNLDRSGLQYGLTMQQDTRMMLKESFFLNKLQLPVFDSKMTATEVRQRTQEWIREASPLVGGIETEYNQQMCRMQFDTLRHVGAFGPEEYFPNEVMGRDVDFIFSNPLVEAKGTERGQKFLEMKATIAEAAALDPSVIYIPDASIALRDTLDGIGIPAKWLRDEDVVADMIEKEKQAQQAQQYIQTLAAGGEAAKQIGEGAQAVQQAGII